jgi:hypothetical protein
MAGSIEIQKQHIKDFYQHKSQYPELAGYDEKGNYVFYAPQKQSEIGNPKQITKTIPPIVYRKKTPEELQVEDQTYATNVQSAIEKYTAKRMELFTEATKIGADNKVLHKLNMELAEIDKILISERYAHYHIQPYNRFESKINMRDIFFENTVEDRRVDDNLSIVEMRRYPVHREFTPVNEFVSLAEANKMIEPLEEKVQEAVNATLQAKSAAVTPIVKGISKIKKQSVKTEVSGQNKGKVYIGTMRRGGTWSTKPNEAIKVVNVTSAQGKENPYRIDFSPMTPVAGGYKGFWNFESYWQSGKVFKDIPKDVARKWWREQTAPKRKYAGPGSKGKTLQVLHSAWPDHIDKNNKEKEMQWIQSRKEVYVPEYNALVKDRNSIKSLREIINSGKDIMIYDLDGPKLSDGTPTTIEVTLDTLRQKINATDFPFGHGYVVAALLLGISPEEYTMPSAQDIQRVVIPEEEEIPEEKESDVGATAAAAVTAAPAVVAPPTATASVTAAPAAVVAPAVVAPAVVAPAVVAPVKGVPKLGPLRNISVVKKPAVAAAEP